MKWFDNKDKSRFIKFVNIELEAPRKWGEECISGPQEVKATRTSAESRVARTRSAEVSHERDR